MDTTVDVIICEGITKGRMLATDRGIYSVVVVTKGETKKSKSSELLSKESIDWN